MPNIGAVEVLKGESKKIEQHIDHLVEQKEVLDNAISFFTHRASGFGVHRGNSNGAVGATKKKSTKKTSTKRKSMSASKPARSTMDMIRTVLENKGEALGAQEIREAVKETFGVEPSKSYAQMLYKRAKAGTGFYKAGRKYGSIPLGKSESTRAAA
jgi:hypothetical protein